MIYLNCLKVEEQDGTKEIQEIAANKRSLTCPKQNKYKPVDYFKHNTRGGVRVGDNFVMHDIKNINRYHYYV